jgi:hypothetical protein
MPDAVLVCELDGLLDRRVTGGLAELAVGVPDLRCAVRDCHLVDLGLRHAAAGRRAEQMVKMQRLEGVVRADAVAGGLGAEARAGGGLLARVAALLVGGGNERVVLFLGDDVEGFHGKIEG